VIIQSGARITADVAPTVRHCGKRLPDKSKKVLRSGGSSTGHNVPRSQALEDVLGMSGGSKRELVERQANLTVQPSHKVYGVFGGGGDGDVETKPEAVLVFKWKYGEGGGDELCGICDKVLGNKAERLGGHYRGGAGKGCPDRSYVEFLAAGLGNHHGCEGEGLEQLGAMEGQEEVE